MTIKEIAVIGGGIIGRSTAFKLANLGHHVTIIDQDLKQKSCEGTSRTGSKASLGVLMGNTFHRSTGRSWKLRRRSMELWPEWITELSKSNMFLELKTPLIKIAKDKIELEKMKILINERSHLGLKLFDKKSKEFQNINEFNINHGGLISSNDGRLNPLILLDCLKKQLNNLQVKEVHQKASSLHRISNSKNIKWKIILDDKQILKTDYVIICSSLGTQSLIKEIGYAVPMEAILGQAIQVKLKTKNINTANWPGVLIINGINLIPAKNNELILGATLEPGLIPSQTEILKIKNLGGSAPSWIQTAVIKNLWHGIRARPLNQAAPILKKLEPGLILNTGHYRNGVLLAPACAEWISEQI